MTTTEAFATFKSELELPDAKQRQASDAQQDVRARIATHLHISDSFLTGSYSRYTKIHPLSDIDVFLVRNDGPTGLTTDGSGISTAVALQQVNDAVKKAYPAAKVTIQSRSVNAEIPGVSFGFDFIPAWQRAPDGFWIPDRDENRWLPTHPKHHGDLMTAANDAAGKMLKPLVKMAKHWSRNNYDLLRSFHIELMCSNIITEKQPSWPVGMATILAYLPDHAGKVMMDPAYGVSRIDKALTPDELSKLTLRISSDAKGAIEALTLENAGHHEEAIAKWKHIFLSGFPK